MERHGELDHAEAGTQMPSRHRHGIDGLLAQLIGELAQLRLMQATKICRHMHGIEQGRFTVRQDYFLQMAGDRSLARFHPNCSNSAFSTKKSRA